jgi:8-oxo-dGTP pyrophosphatase MutT (NUDIX family)
MSKPLEISFRPHTSASKFSISAEAYISENPDVPAFYQYLATGAIVFDQSDPKRVLLIQRASNDSMPNLWETPGGGCDAEDQTVLHSVARELWEEAGLVAKLIGPPVGDGYVFNTRTSKAVRKLNFIVKVDAGDAGIAVRLDPLEHQNFLWATEQEIKDGNAGKTKLEFTTADQKAVILEAFRVESTPKQES